MELSSLKRDVARIEAGEWVGDIPQMGDLRLRVRGIGSKVYQTLLARLQRACPRNERERDGSLKPEAAARVQGQAMAEAILLEWDGIIDDGKPVPYSAELAQQWLPDPEFAHFAGAVFYAASVVENGKEAVTEQLEKN